MFPEALKDLPMRVHGWIYGSRLYRLEEVFVTKMELGENISVCRLSTRDTDPECLGEGTKLIPSRDLVSHLGTPPLPPASLLWRENRVHLNA